MVRFLTRLLIGLFFLAAFIGATAFYYGKTKFEAPGPLAEQGAAETTVLLPKGMSVKSIAKELEESGVIRDARFFEIAIRLQRADGKLRAGEYAIPSAASMADISRILQIGKSILHKITIAEGLTSSQIVNLVEDDKVLLGDVIETPEEGTLLPETYLFLRSTTRHQILVEMREAQQAVFDDHWDDRADELPFDTVEDAIILASIVEKETAIAAERRA